MPTSELRDELKAMEESWQKMYDEEQGGNGKAMLLLALRIQQCCQKLKVYFATHLQPAQLSKQMKAVVHKVFESHAACARDYLNEGAYHDTLKHTQKALELAHQHRAWKESMVMNVLYYKKEAWKGLGEHANYIDVAECRVRAMAELPIPGHDRVAALLEIATVQITQQDLHAAIKTAREALSVDGAPPTLRNISRVKLGVALLGIGHSDEALRELERCDREWTMSVEGTNMNTAALKRDKAVLDTCLKRLRQLRANSGTGGTPASQPEGLHAMSQRWDAMYQSEARDGKTLLQLAFRLQRFSQKYIKHPEYARHVPDEERAQQARDFDRAVIKSHVVCAVECLKARAFRDTVDHTMKASQLCQAHGDLCWDLVADVLSCEMEAWIGLGEHTRHLATAKLLAQIPTLPGPQRVDALCEAASVEIHLLDFSAAITTAREALGIEGVPQASRNIARMKLGAALLGTGRGDEALRELERCDSEWTMSGEGTSWGTDALKGHKTMLDQTLGKVRRLEANKAVLVGAPIRKDVLDEYLRLLMAGSHDGALAQAERAVELALKEPGGSKTATFPGLEARTFTLANCFLLDDHRAHERLDRVKKCARGQLDDHCPICLERLVWPVALAKGSHVIVHSLKKATHRNGDQGVVEQVCVGTDRRVQVRFCPEPERGVLTVEERKAVLRCFQVNKQCFWAQEVCRAAEASLGAPEGSLDQDAVNEVINDVIGLVSMRPCSTAEEIAKEATASVEEAIAKELARLDVSSAYSLRIRSANLKVSEGYVEASRRAFMTNCMHCFHARCIKRAVDEGQQTCPVCGEEVEFAETLVECAQMPSWDRPSYVD